MITEEDLEIQKDEKRLVQTLKDECGIITTTDDPLIIEAVQIARKSGLIIPIDDFKLQ